jgi:hypothetical protein
MLPQHMPYYQGPRIPAQINSIDQDADAAYCQSHSASIVECNGTGMSHLSHVPIRFGEFDTVTPAGTHVGQTILSLSQKTTMTSVTRMSVSRLLYQVFPQVHKLAYSSSTSSINPIWMKPA